MRAYLSPLKKANPNDKFEKLKDAAAKARQPFDKDAWLNLAFYQDQQYVEWSDDAAAIRRVPRREGFENTPRPVANKIMHFVCQEHSFTLQNKPTFDVLPPSDDVVDASNAQVALAYLRWLAEPQQAGFEAELSDAVLWALAAGEGYFKWVWNPRLKRPDVTSVSPFDIYVDPYTKKFRDARYVIHSQFMDVEQIYDIYGKEIKPSDQDKTDPVKSALLRDMGNVPVLQGAIVNELWMKPNRRNEQGVFVVWSGNDTLVEQSGFPYKHGRLPFTQIGSVIRPGVPHHTCAVKYMRSGQMELNKYHAQRIMIREAFANPKWWVPAELELDSPPDDSPRQVLSGNSMGGQLEPKILQPSGMPDNGDGQWITEELQDIVGLHEVSQAGVPGRVEAARAIEMLQETDKGRLAHLIQTLKDSLSEGGWQLLQLAGQYVTEEQILMTYSRDGMPEVKRFKGDIIKKELRVQVTMGTGLSQSRAGRQDQVMTMWQNGILTDPEIMAELLEIPVGTITPTRAHDIRLARNENYTMAGGDAVTPNSWDDHEIHLREHNNFRKTTEYLELPTDEKTKFEYHCETHEKLWLSELMKLAERQQVMAMAAGAPGQMPPPAGDQGSTPQQPDATQQSTPQPTA